MASTNKYCRLVITGIALVLGLLASNASSRILSSDRSIVELHEQWMAHYSRVYEDAAEKDRRFNIFKENVEIIEATNKLNLGYTLGLNEFSDLTNEEFRASHNGYRSQMKRVSNLESSSFEYENLGALPASVDWRAAGAVNPIKNQGQCGCCWAFSAVAATESITQIKTGNLTSLSEEEVVDCDTKGNDQGCNGGTPQGAFQFIIGNGGITTEANYPYTGSQGTCNAASAGPVAATISSFTNVAANNEQALQAAVAQQPVSVAIDASGSAFQSYSGGVFTGPCNTTLDHAVVVVGYGTDNSSGLPYWIVRNSWGTSWGEQGYIRMQMGVNTTGLCGIAMDPSYPSV